MSCKTHRHLTTLGQCIHCLTEELRASQTLARTLHQTIAEAALSPIEWDGPTNGYVTVQMEREVWESLQTLATLKVT